MVGSEARLVGRKKARVFKIRKELERAQTRRSRVLEMNDKLEIGLKFWQLVGSRLGLSRVKVGLSSVKVVLYMRDAVVNSVAGVSCEFDPAGLTSYL